MRGSIKCLVMLVFACTCLLLLLPVLSLLSLPGVTVEEAAASPGSGWEVIDLPEEISRVSHISAVDASTCYIAGGSGGTYQGDRDVIAKTTDGGENWSVVFESEDVHIFDIDAVDADNLWVIAYVREVVDSEVSRTFHIFKSSDGGETLISKYSADGQYIYDYQHWEISAVDTSVAWVMGEPSMPGLKTSDGGETWTAINPGFLAGGCCSYDTSICAVDADTAWASAWSLTWNRSNLGGDPISFPGPPWSTNPPYHVVIARTTDGGATWAAAQMGTYDEGYRDISAADADSAIALGKDITYDPNPRLIWVTMYLTNVTYPYFYMVIASTSSLSITHDGGISWMSQAVDTPFNLNAADMGDSSVAWVVGNDGVILKTIDGGVTGFQQLSGTTSNLVDVDAVDPTTAWALSSTTVLRTTNGGDSLPDIRSIAPPSGEVGAEVTITGCDFGDTRGSSYVSFGGIQATEYISWQDDRIDVKVPAGVTGEAVVKVTTPGGISNGKPFASTTPAPPPCGTGASTGMLMLGLTLGLIYLAGSAGLKRRRRRG